MNPYDDIPAAKGTFIDTSPVTDDTKTEPAAAEDTKTISGARKKMRLEATEESLTETELVIHKIEPHLHSDKKFQRAPQVGNHNRIKSGKLRGVLLQVGLAVELQPVLEETVQLGFCARVRRHALRLLARHGVEV
jgi:hypothetical protein